jgi:branched-chain amino acid aminotransferase
MAELTYYVNGQLVPVHQAALPLDDLGIVRGYGVFDLLRTYGTTPFRLRDHVRRLESSAQQIGLALPWRTEELERTVLETYAANPIPNAAIRIIVTGGPSENFMTPGNRPSLVVMVHPPSPPAASQYTQGVKVVSTLMDRILPTVKSINYMAAIMAMHEAAKAGAVEAIYLDEQDRVTEGTRANLFVVRGQRLITPREGILKGITRQVVMEIAAAEFEVVESAIHYRDLAHMDEAFLTSTTKEVLPVVQMDDLVIGEGHPGPVTRRVMELFTAYTRRVTQAVAA